LVVVVVIVIVRRSIFVGVRMGSCCFVVVFCRLFHGPHQNIIITEEEEEEEE